MEGLIQCWGIPLALYGDRHGVFKFSGNPRHIQPPVEATHFSRAMVELGIQQIFARSPQAKGRGDDGQERQPPMTACMMRPRVL